MDIEILREQLIGSIDRQILAHMKEIELLTKEYVRILKLNESEVIALSSAGKSRIKNID